ncbi:MAG: beta-eliminating lyase-related protein [Vicinamibacteria bacterium]|nr:beta-eliminating lyase-related protein [Vicinamibacteria bacterium]
MENFVDLRSDTVTRPTPSMRQAMAEAEVGDDVYGEDPTVNRLEAEAAALLGFEAALFVPTGSMGNEIAIGLHTRPGQEVLAEERAHVIRYELCAMAALFGAMPKPVRAEDGHLRPEHVRASAGPRPYYANEVGLVVLENSANLAGGTVQAPAEAAAVIAAAREAGFRVHVDGARLWNAAVALGVPPAELVRGADSVMVCLSKGLCAPVGSLIAGSRGFVTEARKLRKRMGGGMRQVGVLAAAGRVALLEMRARLGDDHDNARRLFQALSDCPGVEPVPPRTNIVVARLTDRDAPGVVSALRDEGVLASAMDATTLRLVTHHDAPRAACERAAEALRRAFRGPAPA